MRSVARRWLTSALEWPSFRSPPSSPVLNPAKVGRALRRAPLANFRSGVASFRSRLSSPVLESHGLKVGRALRRAPLANFRSGVARPTCSRLYGHMGLERRSTLAHEKL